jgi:tRNA(fMet)-specific endonuclease VapC
LITHLLDTDICIQAIKKRNRGLAAKITKHAGVMAISDVTLFELYFGAHGYENPEQRLEVIEEFRMQLRVLPFDTEAASIGGRIRHTLSKRGHSIGPFDLQIAATALSKELILVTGNKREFTRIQGLKLENWL